MDNHRGAPAFWSYLDILVRDAKVVIDRPKGSHHPRYRDVVYPLDYGYLDGTTAGDGDGIDVWIGANASPTITAVICTVDKRQRDAEIKVLLGCDEHEEEQILAFHNQSSHQAGILVRRPIETSDSQAQTPQV